MNRLPRPLLALLLATGLALAISPRLFACPAPEEHATELARGEVLVALRERAGHEIKEGCAVAWLPEPLEDVAAVVRDAASYAEFLPRVRSSSLVVEAEGRRLNRQYLDFPFPVGDRFYTVSLVESRPDDRSWRLEWTYVPGSGNVRDTEGSWLVEQGEGGVMVTYRVATDPGGHVPRWAVHQASRRTLPQVLVALRDRVRALRTARLAAGDVKGR